MANAPCNGTKKSGIAKVKNIMEHPGSAGSDRREISQVCPPDRIEIIQGRYEDILPYQTSAKAFDLVHIDCDWYESSRVVLDYLKDHLSPGAVLQIDDYGHWQGSRKAFEEAGWLDGYQAGPVDGAWLLIQGLLSLLFDDYWNPDRIHYLICQGIPSGVLLVSPPTAYDIPH